MTTWGSTCGFRAAEGELGSYLLLSGDVTSLRRLFARQTGVLVGIELRRAGCR
jgi:hypothetical protein